MNYYKQYKLYRFLAKTITVPTYTRNANAIRYKFSYDWVSGDVKKYWIPSKSYVLPDIRYKLVIKSDGRYPNIRRIIRNNGLLAEGVFNLMASKFNKVR